MHHLALVAVSHASLTSALGLASWPVILAAFCGIIASHLTAFFTHRAAPQWLKSGVDFGLVTLAGILITVQVVPGHTWKDYIGVILPAWITSIATHYSGLTSWVTAATGGVGIGANVPPLVDTSLAPATDPAFPGSSSPNTSTTAGTPTTAPARRGRRST